MNIFITGTDTNVGKTVVSAWLCKHLKMHYWKPIQTGIQTDQAFVKMLTQTVTYKEAYSFPDPISPHLASKNANAEINLSRITHPAKHNLIIEGAGGVLTPLNYKQTILDLILYLKTPVLVVARSTLGTINHTCLTLESLRLRNIPVLGVILNGPYNIDNKEAIEHYGNTKVLAQLPFFEDLSSQTLAAFSCPLTSIVS